MYEVCREVAKSMFRWRLILWVREVGRVQIAIAHGIPLASFSCTSYGMLTVNPRGWVSDIGNISVRGKARTSFDCQ